jgi:hypothetical protein
MSMFERVHMPAFDGVTEWLNSELLGPAELRGDVVVVNFWTLMRTGTLADETRRVGGVTKTKRRQAL